MLRKFIYFALKINCMPKKYPVSNGFCPKIGNFDHFRFFSKVFLFRWRDVCYTITIPMCLIYWGLFRLPLRLSHNESDRDTTRQRHDSDISATFLRHHCDRSVIVVRFCGHVNGKCPLLPKAPADWVGSWGVGIEYSRPLWAKTKSTGVNCLYINSKS